MDCTCIPYTRVPRTSDLLRDYLYRYERVAGFYNGPPFDFKSYTSTADQLQHDGQLRRQVAEILTAQNRAFGCGEKALANLSRLSEPGTYAVVTGQQVGLFGGPAFTLYKALTVVRLAGWLSERGLPTVPVFWLADEDHDLEEVAQAATLDEEYNLILLEDGGDRPAERPSVGYVRLTAGINEALNRLEATLPTGELRQHLLADLRESYQPGNTWAKAFGRFMARLFSRWGVVLIDPLDESIHRLCTKLYEQAIVQAEALRERLLDRSRELISAGYHAQVHVGEDSTLVFASREGNRLPLHQREGEFFLGGIEKVSAAELRSWVERHPLDFSPNVVMRPLVQDMILPSVAYVAGPAETAYLAQAQAVYETFGRPMPIIFPRAGFTFVDRRTERLMEKYGVGIEDVWQGEEHLGQRIAAAGLADGWSDHFGQAEQELAGLLERLRRDVETLDPTLLDALQNATEKMQYQMERLRGKISRAAVQRSELLGRHQQVLMRFLMPGKELQERGLSGVYFLGRAGYELLDLLLDRIQTDSSDHQVILY